MDKVAAVLPYEVDASAYLGDVVLEMVEEVLLDDGKMDGVENCRHTWLYRDLQTRHNEMVGEDINSLMEGHDAEPGRTKNQNA